MKKSYSKTFWYRQHFWINLIYRTSVYKKLFRFLGTEVIWSISDIVFQPEVSNLTPIFPSTNSLFFYFLYFLCSLIFFKVNFVLISYFYFFFITSLTAFLSSTICFYHFLLQFVELRNFAVKSNFACKLISFCQGLSLIMCED